VILFVTYFVSPDGEIRGVALGDMPAGEATKVSNCARVPFGVVVVREGMEQDLPDLLRTGATATIDAAGITVSLSEEVLARLKYVMRGHSTYAGIEAALAAGEELLPLTHQWLRARHGSAYVEQKLPDPRSRIGTDIIVQDALDRLRGRARENRFSAFVTRADALKKEPR